MTIKQLKVYSPASIANLGPGFDVFGVALDGLGDKVSVKRVSEPGVRVIMKGYEADQIPVKARLNSAGAVMEAALSRLSEPEGVVMEIEKGIPPGKGMGSSGASAAGAAVAAVKRAEKGIDMETAILHSFKDTREKEREETVGVKKERGF